MAPFLYEATSANIRALTGELDFTTYHQPITFYRGFCAAQSTEVFNQGEYFVNKIKWQLFNNRIGNKAQYFVLCSG